jgi:uncharacterized NAD-dependent epimerase/dehydratase family protein
MESDTVTLSFAPFPLAGRRVALLAPGEFSTFGAKTAVCYLRYRPSDVACVVDPVQSGRSVEEIIGFGGRVPIVASIDAARAKGAEIAVVGIAPQGGRLSDDLRRYVFECAEAGMDIVSGLHDFLLEDAQIAEAAAKSGSRIWDVRVVPADQSVSQGAGCQTGAKTVAVVGSDCNVGKMTVTLELFKAACARGIDAAWAATGQTGMMLRGRGIAIDRVVADFVGGATEELVEYEGREREIVFVEGQGSIVHPGYAGVALGLIYGAMPDCMVLVHAPSRQTIGDTHFDMPSLDSLIAMHESLMKPFKRSRVVAIALNTLGFEIAVALDVMERVKKETGLPVSDAVRFGVGDILEAVLRELGPLGGGSEARR